MARRLILLGFLAGVVCLAPAQEPDRVYELPERPVFRADVVERITIAINYRHRSGPTRVDFKGTPLMPQASGEARVESKGGYIEISAKFRNLKPAITFGAEYLTYVLWAITPEGRAANLGEIHLKGGRGKLEVTTELQFFGMVVTAEPYFAVRQPSDLVVLENEPRPDTKGRIDVIDAKYELLKRGRYKPLANPLNLTVDPKIPLDLYEARNAVQIARASGAEKYATETFLKALRALEQAEAYLARKAGNKPVAMLAREAVQTAEDARELAIRRREQERLKREREEAARREAEARKRAEEEARRRAEEERLRREREEAARKARLRAEQEAAARKRLEEELKKAREAARQAEERARQAMELLKERTASFGEERARWEQERARREAEEAKRLKRLAELRRAELRVRLFSQLSRILFTRDSDEGLVIELRPEHFQPGTAELSVEGREKLAVVAGLLLANPGLTIVPEAGAGQAPDPLTAARLATVRKLFETYDLGDERLWAAVPEPETHPGPGSEADGAAGEGAKEAEPSQAAETSDARQAADPGKPIRLLITGEPIRLPPPETAG